MLTAWLTALPTGADPDRARATGAELLARWGEPHRHYHTVAHLAAMLSIVDEHDGTAETRLATWFHDAVYDPTRGDNEEASARLAEERLPPLGVDPTEVVRLVLLTRTHDPAPDDRNGALLTDADLAILAAPRQRYDAYAAAIREEHRHVPDELFTAGRRAVLEHLLSLPTLYHLPELRTNWEARARENLARELSGL